MEEALIHDSIKINENHYIDFCDIPSECKLCYETSRRLKKIVVKEFVEGWDLPPTGTISHIIIEVVPTKVSKFMFSVAGINQIVFDLFDSNELEGIKNEDIMMSVFYKNRELYTIPTLNITLTIPKELKREDIIIIEKRMYEHLLINTGQPGFVKKVEYQSKEDLTEQLFPPFDVPVEPMVKKGVYFNQFFSDNQLKDMNFIQILPPLKIKINDVLKNKFIYELMDRYFTLED